ncbi:hypothetical protein BDK51DRAFT_34826 [Blyttiomyces helicus]|uniref:Uncharacterized protein n=1 Tax=Blyttiomyces helicus TaxID=388810 RepID=A0A4P9WMY0_9FUNG|nr:hypothetical protein BDK51DRAFT_34826 [Blyttiomyces helicus]|eukprot:RKO94429.1 hypothetical protein BDK51DRAFT_34826 [Blyttiomyces helicus]
MTSRCTLTVEWCCLHNRATQVKTSEPGLLPQGYMGQDSHIGRWIKTPVPGPPGQVKIARILRCAQTGLHKIIVGSDRARVREQGEPISSKRAVVGVEVVIVRKSLVHVKGAPVGGKHLEVHVKVLRVAGQQVWAETTMIVVGSGYHLQLQGRAGGAEHATWSLDQNMGSGGVLLNKISSKRTGFGSGTAGKQQGVSRQRTNYRLGCEVLEQQGIGLEGVLQSVCLTYERIGEAGNPARSLVSALSRGSGDRSGPFESSFGLGQGHIGTSLRRDMNARTTGQGATVFPGEGVLDVSFHLCQGEWISITTSRAPVVGNMVIKRNCSNAGGAADVLSVAVSDGFKAGFFFLTNDWTVGSLAVREHLMTDYQGAGWPMIQRWVVWCSVVQEQGGLEYCGGTSYQGLEDDPEVVITGLTTHAESGSGMSGQRGDGAGGTGRTGLMYGLAGKMAAVVFMGLT